MICRVVLDWTEADIDLLLDKLSSVGTFMIMSGVIYFNTHTSYTKQKLKVLLRKAGVTDSVIFDITPESIRNEGGYVADWAKEYFTVEAMNKAVEELNSAQYAKEMEILQTKIELANALKDGLMVAVPKTVKEDEPNG